MQSLGVNTDGGAPLGEVAVLLRERAKTLVELADTARYFYEAPTSYDEKARKKQLKPETALVLTQASTRLQALDTWTSDSIQASLDDTVQAMEIGFGKLGQPLRLAITGLTQSPSMADVMALIDKDAVLERMARAIDVCEQS